MIFSVMTGPVETVPVIRSADLSRTDNGLRRRFMLGLYPDEYIRWYRYCKRIRVPMATLARQVLLAYLTKMEGRDGSGCRSRPDDG